VAMGYEFHTSGMPTDEAKGCMGEPLNVFEPIRLFLVTLSWFAKCFWLLTPRTYVRVAALRTW
jgi:hypothetical protein